MPWLGVFIAGVAACTTPATDFARQAAALGVTRAIVHGRDFDHLVLRPPRSPSSRVHIYLDGDGTPWLGGLPAFDPTPRQSLVLPLMAVDPAFSLYLGRPCYHGFAEAPGCAPRLWTSARYSDTVVSSMTAALRQVVSVERITDIVWFGHSGGGNLAMLLAGRFPETAAVVTLSAPLDIVAWTAAHGDVPLTGSLDPSRQPALPEHVVQIHYVGQRDRVVPVEVVRRGVTGHGRLVVVPDYDHVCCWARDWPAILADVERVTRRRRAWSETDAEADARRRRRARVVAHELAHVRER